MPHLAPEPIASENGLPSKPSDPASPSDLASIEKKMDYVVTAVFGNPLDKEDHGLAGELRETRTMVGTKLDKLFHSVLGLAGGLMAVSVGIALSIH